MAGKSFIFIFADVEVREREFSLIKAGEVLPVEPKAFRMLLILLRNPQKLIPKDELLTAVWGDTAVSENSLARSIALLRRLLGDEARDPRFIETVATVGYRWLCKVEVSEEPSGEAEAPGNPPVPHTDEKKTGGRKLVWAWALGGVCVLAVGAATAWYMHRPLPPPRISEYTQLTFDGHGKDARGTDGSRLYFNEFQEGIWQIAVSGGVSQRIPIDLPGVALHPMGISPDGSSMLVSSYERGRKPAQPISIVRTLGGSVRYLTDGGWATWSPDGRSVVYTTGDGDLNLIQSDGTGNHKLAHVGGGAASVGPISWSPDGKTIRFTRDYRLWEISSNGANPHELLPDWRPSYWTCCGYWSQDGEFFFFRAWDSRQQGNRQVWVLDERRGLLRQPPAEPIQLTSGPIRWGATIPSRDGKKVFADGYTLRGELVRFNSKSGQFEPFLGGISAEFVDFSSDGNSVAYVSFPEGILWRANRDGNKPVQLTEPPTYPLQPRWSPDGSQIVFMAQPLGGQAKSYIVSSSGGSPRLLLPEDTEPQDDPNWSPDGRKIAFSNSPHEGSGRPGVIRILDVASRQISTLPGSGYSSPRWSPDGRFIEAEADDGLTIKVFDLVNQNSWVLQIGKAAIFHVWSRDGQFIYFIMDQGHVNVFRIPSKGGKPELVVDLKDFQNTGFSNGYFTLDPTGAPLLLRDRGTDDLYALTLEKK